MALKLYNKNVAASSRLGGLGSFRCENGSCSRHNKDCGYSRLQYQYLTSVVTAYGDYARMCARNVVQHVVKRQRWQHMLKTSTYELKSRQRRRTSHSTYLWVFLKSTHSCKRAEQGVWAMESTMSTLRSYRTTCLVWSQLKNLKHVLRVIFR